MKPLIKISNTVIKRILATKTACKGKLYGNIFKNTITIIGLQTCNNENKVNLVHAFPAEVDICGFFEIGDGSHNPTHILNCANQVDVTDNPVFICCKIAVNNALVVNVVTNEQIETIKYTSVNEQEIYSQYVHIQVKGHLPLSCEANPKSIEAAFAVIRKTATSGGIGFTFATNKVCILGNEYDNNLTANRMSLEELCVEFNGQNEGNVRNKKKTAEKFGMEIINVNLLRRATKDSETTSNEHAPLCILTKKPVSAFSIPIMVDTLSMVHKQTEVLKLYEILVESVVRYIKLFEMQYLNSLNNKENSVSISMPETFHFYASECGHFLSQIYKKNRTEQDLAVHRKQLHKTLLLQLERPLFRRANCYAFKTTTTTSGPLINPHESVKITENGGQVSLVKGNYEYYHYCQQNMDDNGWGCAYRSLQTLASWFKLQGFTNRAVPTYKEIQKCLHDIGDKPASFVGSKQWIGSTEVNFVLNTLLGVTSKILFVSSGEEMASKGPELVHHFEHHGAPVMIGGGVLAHTILGVDYNKESGKLMFLILDPHYTGAEDLHVITSKGWCGWKGCDFWNKTAYYNMCMPQVPREI